MRAGRRAAATVTGAVASLALLLLGATGAAGVGWTPSVDDDSLLIRARNASRGAAEYEANPDAGAYVWKRDLPCWSRYPEIDRDSSEACWGGSAIQHGPDHADDDVDRSLPRGRRPAAQMARDRRQRLHDVRHCRLRGRRAAWAPRRMSRAVAARVA